MPITIFAQPSAAQWLEHITGDQKVNMEIEHAISQLLTLPSRCSCILGSQSVKVTI